MYLRASEMSKQAWSEAVKTNNLEEHYMLLDKEQKCWGGASKCWGGGKTCWGVRQLHIVYYPENNITLLELCSNFILQFYDGLKPQMFKL